MKEEQTFFSPSLFLKKTVEKIYTAFYFLLDKKKNKQSIPDHTLMHSTDHENNKTTETSLFASYQEWLNAIENLTQLVKTKQSLLESYDDYKNNELDIIGVTTYLYYIDRLAFRVKEHLLSFQSIKEKENIKNNVTNNQMFRKINTSFQKCHQTVLELTNLLQTAKDRMLFSSQFVNHMNTLEIDSNTLENLIRLFKEYIYEQEIASKNVYLERTLVEFHINPKTYYNLLERKERKTNLPPQSYLGKETLSEKVKMVIEVEDKNLLNHIIENYDALRKCYVVARSAMVKASLDYLHNDIESIIISLSRNERDQKVIFDSLRDMFNQVESLRFSANRKSHCSKLLFDKAKEARRNLRKACMHHSLARIFIQESNLSSCQKKHFSK